MSRKAKWVGVSFMTVALLFAGVGLAVDDRAPQADRSIKPDEPVATMPGHSGQTEELRGQAGEFKPNLEKAKDLMGVNVLNDQDERLGTIHDIVLSPDHNAISYVVLSHGGVWGIGDKFFAVPWAQFSFRPGETPQDPSIPILSGVTRADLERAPGFDQNNWPATASENWLGTEHTTARAPDMGMHGDLDRAGDVEGAPSGDIVARSPDNEGAYPTPGAREPVGTQPRGEADTDTINTIDQRRLSRLLDMSVRNLQDENLGRLDNAILDVNRGQIAYGILSMRTGFLGLSREYVAVPWSALDLASEPGIARLDVDEQTLTAMTFDEDEFPNLEDMQYSRQLHAQFNATPYWEVLGFVPGEAGTRAGAEHHGMHHPKEAKTIRGAIESVGTFRLEGPAMEGAARDGVSLRIRTDEGKLVTVHTAPREYLNRQNITFNAGDQVTVTGSEAKVAGSDVVIASKIEAAGTTVNLRSPEGRPLWLSGEVHGYVEGQSPASPQHSCPD
jgi:sporulation protein YlmC with PRC-barrel domain